MPKATYYAPDDIKKHFKRASKAPRATKLSAAFKPGCVLILLAGRFKGRRVVFLKQLKSGLLLVTGPYKVNGVPLKRVSRAYVIPTTTTVDISKVSMNDVDDTFFAREKVKKTGHGKNTIFENRTMTAEDKKQKIADKVKKQVALDKPLLEAVKKTEMMSGYLQSRFTIRNGMKVHELKF